MTIKTSLDLVRYIRHHLAGSEFQDVQAVEDFTKEKMLDVAIAISDLEGSHRSRAECEEALKELGYIK